ncbi:IPT/TIG domain-containing protein [Nocardia salmonicida]|uniref:IPT/TIG domain-containing protein n=1 Tax=Nocardia salmonicida TaxID=53431 RepID=UPI000AA98283|nr:IPT/TIG domain-containing protein [Nocardia salmonicida]
MSAITASAPTSGPATGAASVAITGTDFGWPTATRFGSTATPFTIESATQSTAIALP